MDDRLLLAKLKREYEISAEEFIPIVEIAPLVERAPMTRTRLPVFRANPAQRYLNSYRFATA